MNKNLAKKVSNILLFKQSPADLPYSFTLLGVGCLVYTFALIASYPHYISFVRPLVFVVLWISYTYLLLLMSSFRNRFIQTMSCFFWIALIFQFFKILIIKLTWFLMSLLLTPGYAFLSKKILFIPMAFTMLILLWELSVIFYIYKQALVKSHVAALATIGLVLMVWLIFNT